jgi:hypothetical protein
MPDAFCGTPDRPRTQLLCNPVSWRLRPAIPKSVKGLENLQVVGRSTSEESSQDSLHNRPSEGEAFDCQFS